MAPQPSSEGNADPNDLFARCAFAECVASFREIAVHKKERRVVEELSRELEELRKAMKRR